MPHTNEKTGEYNEKIKFLHKRLNDRIESFQERRKQNRALSFRLKISSTIFSAATTILLGLKGGNELVSIWLTNIALFLSALVTVVTAWEAFYNHKELWIKYTKARAQLLAIKDKLDYSLAGNDENLSNEELDQFYESYQSVLDEVNSSWLQLRSGDDKKDEPLKNK